ncbi:hypothetical protein GCM10009122_35490 [Fulvivirga kasyanovii]|uniref:Response regulator transcription factor n=1 Tax=Fulvivirga kasyanovii TaxID=396812 RepID=A0ABW9RLR1_9BACT|nr:response regulator [Fulvivirga kasyanovii]MTI25029.1 response regulator transcription factor [Fulvivirga kasyanovii]
MVEKVKILIVEDEAVLAMDIAYRLKRFGYEIFPPVHGPHEALTSLERGQPDICVLDIHLAGGEMDGIELARKINAQYGLPLIFLTSHDDDLMINRAKEVNPAAYILKPFNDKEVRIAIEIALANSSPSANRAQRADALSINDSLFLRNGQHHERVKFEHILWLKADDNYTEIHTASKTYVYSIVLKKMEENLPEQFYRVHRSFMVNKECISGFEGNNLLINGERIPVSKPYRSMVFSWFRVI